MVHRKGASRSYPNQPVILGGSMETGSYLLMGTEGAMQKKTAFAQPLPRRFVVFRGEQAGDAGAIGIRRLRHDEIVALRVGQVVDDPLCRRALVGDAITYVINRNLNFTNVCVYDCKFIPLIIKSLYALNNAVCLHGVFHDITHIGAAGP